MVAGHELFAQAGKDVALQWEYEPPKLNGKPLQTNFHVEDIFELPKEEKKAEPKYRRARLTPSPEVDPLPSLPPLAGGLIPRYSAGTLTKSGGIATLAFSELRDGP